MLNFDLQNHRPLREIVYEELKRQIMIGEIPPGTRMMEVELADDMGVSRTPIREAIRKLEKEGLVSIEPRRGAYALDVSIKDMVDVLEVREFWKAWQQVLQPRRLPRKKWRGLGLPLPHTKKRLNPETLRRLLRKTRFSISLSLIAAATKR